MPIEAQPSSTGPERKGSDQIVTANYKTRTHKLRTGGRKRRVSFFFSVPPKRNDVGSERTRTFLHLEEPEPTNNQRHEWKEREGRENQKIVTEETEEE